MNSGFSLCRQRLLVFLSRNGSTRFVHKTAEKQRKSIVSIADPEDHQSEKEHVCKHEEKPRLSFLGKTALKSRDMNGTSCPGEVLGGPRASSEGPG